MPGLIYKELSYIPKVFLENRITDNVPYTEHYTRKTETAMEVVSFCSLCLCTLNLLSSNGSCDTSYVSI